MTYTRPAVPIQLTEESVETFIDQDLVRFGGDYVYPGANDDEYGSCFYLEYEEGPAKEVVYSSEFTPTPKAPSCWVGRLLSAHGVPLAALQEAEGSNAWALIKGLEAERVLKVPTNVTRGLVKGQRAQDKALPLGAVVQVYRETARLNRGSTSSEPPSMYDEDYGSQY